MKPKVYVTRKIPSCGLVLLEAECDITLNENEGPPSHDELLSNISDKDGLLCLLTDRITSEIINAAKNLKVISTYSAGYEHIDVEEATKRGIYIGYTPHALTDATADLTMALLLATARKIPEAYNIVKEGRWRVSWSPTFLLGHSVWGKTLGIIGAGRIGKAVAKRAKGFNMKILYNNPKRLKYEEETALSIEYRELEELLRESDFITIHTPLNESTQNLIDETKLKLMKPNAILINTARGPIIDEKALAKALKEKWIAGAGLDVYSCEPIQKDNPLFECENLVMLPHIGSATFSARSKMAELASLNLLSVLKGKPPLSWVNPEVEKIRPLQMVKML